MRRQAGIASIRLWGEHHAIGFASVRVRVGRADAHSFAIKAFQKQAMAYDAYMLINRGFAAFRPRDDSYSICCPESFLVLLTSNAKFESHAECLARRGRGQDVATD